MPDLNFSSSSFFASCMAKARGSVINTFWYTGHQARQAQLLLRFKAAQFNFMRYAMHKRPHKQHEHRQIICPRGVQTNMYSVVTCRAHRTPFDKPYMQRTYAISLTKLHNSTPCCQSNFTLRASVLFVLLSKASCVTRPFKSTSSVYRVGMRCW